VWGKYEKASRDYNGIRREGKKGGELPSLPLGAQNGGTRKNSRGHYVDPFTTGTSQERQPCQAPVAEERAENKGIMTAGPEKKKKVDHPKK